MWARPCASPPDPLPRLFFPPPVSRGRFFIRFPLAIRGSLGYTSHISAGVMELADVTDQNYVRLMSSETRKPLKYKVFRERKILKNRHRPPNRPPNLKMRSKPCPASIYAGVMELADVLDSKDINFRYLPLKSMTGNRLKHRAISTVRRGSPFLGVPPSLTAQREEK